MERKGWIVQSLTSWWRLSGDWMRVWWWFSSWDEVTCCCWIRDLQQSVVACDDRWPWKVHSQDSHLQPLKKIHTVCPFDSLSFSLIAGYGSMLKLVNLLHTWWSHNIFWTWWLLRILFGTFCWRRHTGLDWYNYLKLQAIVLWVSWSCKPFPPVILVQMVHLTWSLWRYSTVVTRRGQRWRQRPPSFWPLSA